MAASASKCQTMVESLRQARGVRFADGLTDSEARGIEDRYGFRFPPDLRRLELCLPRVHAECDYLAPLRFEDEVEIHLLVDRKGKSSVTYQFRFRRLGGSGAEEVASGRVTVACAAREKNGTFKSERLPDVLAEQIQEAPSTLLANGASNTLACSPRTNAKRGVYRSMTINDPLL